LEFEKAKEMMEGGRCPLCRELENAIHILLKCLEPKRWRYQFLSAEWLKIIEEVAYKKMIGCNDVNKLRG
jgi:hypothetical protein